MASPAACPEAALSLCVQASIDGHLAQFTIRGQTPEEFHRNLAAVHGLLEATPPPAAPSQPAASQPSAPAAPAPAPEGYCARHQTQMVYNQPKPGAKGGAWWSHKTAEGWCKGK